MDLIYGEFFPLNGETPRTLRKRIASFEPLLGHALSAVQLAASELASGYVRYGHADGFTFRLFIGDDRFRVEMIDGLTSEQALTSPGDPEGSFRLAILDGATDRWGVLGDGVSVVWFEVLRTGGAAELWRAEQ